MLIAIAPIVPHYGDSYMEEDSNVKDKDIEFEAVDIHANVGVEGSKNSLEPDWRQHG